ncbi:MAG: ABC transporter ATP-binding protein [Clostridiales bacterium]|nr:ABC transporter ATP-binding protein [Clostridiales bacterium]
MSLLEVRHLSTSFFTPAGEVRAVNDLSFSLEEGETIGIVGESGSGKSVTAYSIMQILTHPGRIIGGSIKYDGEELVGCTDKTISSIRGNKISMIFQDPMTSLNPVYTVGNQLEEAIMLHTKRDKAQSRKRAVEMIRLVGINDPDKRVRQYPHELSGGMRQRVMIAMALACEPNILIADEPTTALDVTIQAQILELMKALQQQLGLAIILITHDLGVVAGMCESVLVMYAGKIIERGSAEDIFYNPKHEYTKGLLRSLPSIGSDKENERLIPIAGTPVDMLMLPAGCAFLPRCDRAMKICIYETPEELGINEGHYASCWQNVKALLQADELPEHQIEESRE